MGRRLVITGKGFSKGAFKFPRIKKVRIVLINIINLLIVIRFVSHPVGYSRYKSDCFCYYNVTI